MKSETKDNFTEIPNSEITRRQKIFKRITAAVFIVFVLAVLGYTFYNDFFASGKDFASFDRLWEILGNGWHYIFGALACLCLMYLFKALKIALICKKMTGKAHFKTSLETSIIGIYYNNVTPLAVGGQPFEIYHLSKHGVHGGVASSIPIATFFINQIAFVAIGVCSLVCFNSNAFDIPNNIIGAFPPVFNVLSIIGFVCCLFMPLLVVIFSMIPKIGTALVRFVMRIGAKLKIVKNIDETTENTIKNVVHNSQCLKTIAKNPLMFIAEFLLSVFENLAGSSIAFFALKIFGYELVGVDFFMEWIQVVQISTILFASITFVPTPGNSGAADLSFYLLFSSGITVAGLAFPAMLTWRIFHFYSTLLIGFTFTTLKKRSDAKRIKRNLHSRE